MALSILWPDGTPYNSEVSTLETDFGKTKRVLSMSDGTLWLEHLDILTAGDDVKRTWKAPGKWVTSAYSSALLFKRIEAAWVQTSHQWIINAHTTRETALDMLPFEIIWRRYNVKGNSWQKRNPGSKYDIGDRYDEIIYEACLKWSVEDKNAIKDEDKIVNDPFLDLYENFQPKLDARGLPILIHPKTWVKLAYDNVIHPNKPDENMYLDDIWDAIFRFTERSAEIKTMTEVVQEVIFQTYAETGRLNADGKIEVGLNKKKELVLWDEAELDSLRNMNLETINIDGQEFKFETDALWTSIEQILGRAPQDISKIITARHSDFRDQVLRMDGQPYDDKRKAFNDQAAERTTEEIYIPTALALSNRFAQEVWFTLSQS
jgi:phosphoribosylaminoimidazole-succinocarboxamide synthase